MQNRYAGDVGDYAKLALLRSLSPGLSLGVAWYLYPDENHNDDGRHVSYLNQPEIWRALDPELFDQLSKITRDQRAVKSLEATDILPRAKFAGMPITSGGLHASDRSDARSRWFEEILEAVDGCELVFADPDNGLIDDSAHRRRAPKFGKQIPISEARALAQGRQAVIYHHNTRYPGGHELEIGTWQTRLGPNTVAVRANAYSCRTFFILNPCDRTIQRAIDFANRWSGHKVRFVPPA